MKRISDVITEKEIKNWRDNEVVSIEAGTGAGKSYLIKNTLYNVAKEENKILSDKIAELEKKEDVLYSHKVMKDDLYAIELHKGETIIVKATEE